jgi:transcriptional regulator with XRE-family HTH domain
MSEYLKAIRTDKRLSQKEVASAARITQPTYSNIENGKRQPSVDVAKKIAEVLGFDWTEFFREV